MCKNYPEPPLGSPRNIEKKKKKKLNATGALLEDRLKKEASAEPMGPYSVKGQGAKG